MRSGRVTVEQELAYLAKSIDPVELAWAAGFFDGEGHTGTATKGTTYLVVQIGQGGSAEELERFIAAVGIDDQAQVLGPYGPYGKANLPVYRVMIVGRRAEMVMARLAPLLCSRKRAQYRTALARTKRR